MNLVPSLFKCCFNELKSSEQDDMLFEDVDVLLKLSLTEHLNYFAFIRKSLFVMLN